LHVFQEQVVPSQDVIHTVLAVVIVLSVNQCELLEDFTTFT
jgi:hypothetical protein